MSPAFFSFWVNVGGKKRDLVLIFLVALIVLTLS